MIATEKWFYTIDAIEARFVSQYVFLDKMSSVIWNDWKNVYSRKSMAELMAKIPLTQNDGYTTEKPISSHSHEGDLQKGVGIERHPNSSQHLAGARAFRTQGEFGKSKF